jgi:hypothetical protein
MVQRSDGSPTRDLWKCPVGERPLFRLDVGRTDHLATLLGSVGDQPAEFSGRPHKYRAAQVGKPRLDLGIGNSRIDLPVELVDDLGGIFLGAPMPVQFAVTSTADTGPPLVSAGLSQSPASASCTGDMGRYGRLRRKPPLGRRWVRSAGAPTSCGMAYNSLADATDAARSPAQGN